MVLRKQLIEQLGRKLRTGAVCIFHRTGVETIDRTNNKKVLTKILIE